MFSVQVKSTIYQVQLTHQNKSDEVIENLDGKLKNSRDVTIRGSIPGVKGLRLRFAYPVQGTSIGCATLLWF